MWQILDTITNDTRINLWYFSHIEPEAAAVLELHPTVSLVCAIWAQDVPEALQSPDSQFQREGCYTCKPRNHWSPPPAPHLRPEQILHTLMHLHSCSSQRSACSTQLWRKSAWILQVGWWKFDCKSTLQKVFLNTNSPPQILLSQHVLTHIFLKGCAVLQGKTFSFKSELSVVKIKTFGQL